nr:ABC transporter substrate-binding protein [bacterium]
MKKVRLLALVLIIALLAPFATACGQSGPVLRVFNWEDYIDPSVLKDFTKETGIQIKYIRFTTNEDMYAKLKMGTTEMDVAFPSDYMIERMANEDMLATLNRDNIPNFANLSEFVLNKGFDPDNAYSIPYMWGTLGILYDKTQVQKPVTSWDILWDKDYSGKILMIDSVRDAVGIALIMEGYSLNDFSDEAMEKAKQRLISQKPLLQAYSLDSAKDIMRRGAAAMAVVYSGDAVTAMGKNENLAYAVPEEGSNIWFDNMVVLKNSKMIPEAEQFINFLCREDIAKRNAEYIGYFSPVKGVTEGLVEDGTLPDILPAEDSYDTLEAFLDPGEDISKFDLLWTELTR